MTHLPQAGALAVCVVALAACGSSNDSSGSSGSTASSTPAPAATTPASTSAASSSASSSSGALKISAKESGGLSFSAKTLQAKAGTVTITMNNPSGNSLPHAIAIEGSGVDKDGKTVSAGGTSTVTAKLKPGKYTFYCPVDGHRKAGMEGTLTVS